VRATSRQTHRASCRVRATGTGGPARLPSDRPGSRDPSWLAAFVVHSHDVAPHPVARREPGPPRQRMAGHFELSPTPALVSPRVASPQLVHQAMGERCASLTSATDTTTRAPHGLPDSQVRSPLCFAAPRRARRPTLGQWPPVCPQVKLRLTANLQLQPCRNPSVSRPLGLPRSCADMLP